MTELYRDSLRPDQPISCHWSLSIPPEKNQNTSDFFIFVVEIERDQWIKEFVLRTDQVLLKDSPFTNQGILLVTK